MKKKIEKKLMVNLGCGSNVIPSNDKEDWVNIDNFINADPTAKNFLQADILDIPLADETVDYILCDQVLEHIRMSDVPIVLYEIRRILKKGGKGVIIVPDFRSAAQDWMDYNWNTCFQAIEYQYLSEVIYGNQNHDGEFHKTPFTGGYLHYVLGMVGLRNHQLSFHPKGAPIPKTSGVNYLPNAVLRNAQLVAEIIK